MILEVDTSDNKKPLSTRILFIKDTNQWNTTDRAKVLELVATQCLRWPKGIFKHICYKNSTLNHPRMNLKRQEISESELKNWANRLTSIFFKSLIHPMMLKFPNNLYYCYNVLIDGFYFLVEKAISDLFLIWFRYEAN